jgi:AraC-like DNA-binding protein
MHRIIKLDGWSLPVVKSVTHTTFEKGGVTLFRPDGCWDFVIMKNAAGTLVLRTGLTTTAVPHHFSHGDEILAIAFKASAYMPLMPGERMRDEGVALQMIGRNRFRLGADVLEVPTLDTVDSFVGTLLRKSIVENNALVASLISGHPMAMSERTLQRHFLKTTGLTYKTFTQIERAQKATALLQQGRSAADVAFALGYADQPHMIRSLKAIMGNTPRQIVEPREIVGNLQSSSPSAG